MVHKRVTRWLGLTLAVMLLAGLSGQFVLGQESAPGPRAVARMLTGNAFTYQGYLTDGGSPANGLYDFVFSLYADAAGTQWVASAAPVDDLARAAGELLHLRVAVRKAEQVVGQTGVVVPLERGEQRGSLIQHDAPLGGKVAPFGPQVAVFFRQVLQAEGLTTGEVVQKRLR